MSAIALVQKVKNLPPVSPAALKLISLLDKPATDNDEIVEVLKYDNVLTAKLLRACNAPALGLTEQVSSVDQAVFLLGHQQILHIVMTLAFGSIMAVSSLTYTMEMNELWQHSVVSAVATEIVLEHAPEMDANARGNVAFTAGLLHDIGKLVLAQALSKEEIFEIRDRMERKQISGTDAEKEVLGLDHGEVGAALLQSWRLPENIVEAVANHHRPALQPEPLVSTIVHVANGIAHQAKPSLDQNRYDLHLSGPIVTTFGITEEKRKKMAEAVSESFDRVDYFMGMS
jgi:putative nucleotidyltransferase with HDIG domain